MTKRFSGHILYRKRTTFEEMVSLIVLIDNNLPDWHFLGCI